MSVEPQPEARVLRASLATAWGAAVAAGLLTFGGAWLACRGPAGNAPPPHAVAFLAAMGVAALLLLALLWRRSDSRLLRERLRLEREHRAEGERFRLLMKGAHDIVLLSDAQSRLIDANDRAIESYGYTREELLRLSLADLRTPAERAGLTDQLARLQSGEGVNFRTVHQRKDGSTFPVEGSARHIEIDGIGYNLAILRDLTDRIRAEEALRASEEWHRLYVNATADGIWCVDMQGRLREVNEAYCRMSGYTARELLEMGVSDVEVRESHQAVIERIRQLVASGNQHFVSRHRRKDGTLYDVDVRLQHIPADDGRIVACLRDITEVKRLEAERAQMVAVTERNRRALLDALEDQNLVENQLRLSEASARQLLQASDKTRLALLSLAEDQRLIEARLRERQEMYRALVAGLPDVVLRLDKDGRHLFASSNAEDALGFPAAQILGKTAREAGFPDALCRVWEETTRKTTETGKMSEVEFAIDGKPGRRIFNWRVCPEFDTGGQVRSILSIARDVTDHRDAEAREQVLQDRLDGLKRLESLGVLAGGVAHDLNNILGPLVTLPDILVEELDDIALAIGGRNLAGATATFDVEVMKDSLQVVKESSVRAANTVADLTLLSRRGRFERTAVDLDRLLQKLATTPEIADLKASKPGIALRFPAPQPLRLLGSESHLTRVLFNLIRNAYDAIETEGAVTVAVDPLHLAEPHQGGRETIPRGDYVVIRVTDTGAGIAPDILPRIFEPYFSKKKRTRSTGTGLGLAIVHGIVKEHEGFVEVISQIGAGTTFEVYLPAGDAAIETPDGTESLNVAGTEHVLIVDDEPGQRHLAQRALAHYGYRATVAADANEAVRLFREAVHSREPFDLVVLDMVMHDDSDGLVAYQAILGLKPGQKAIVTSGHSPIGRVALARQLGAGWLAKPYDAHQLAAAVRMALDSPSLHDNRHGPKG